jgi:hypothetical protein
VVAGLVIALISSLLGEGVPAPDNVHSPEETDPSTTILASTTSLPTTTTVPIDASDAVRKAGKAVLDAWGRFAGSGDLAILKNHFHPLSPQLTFLEMRAVEIARAPLGGSPYEFVMAEPVINLQPPGFATMQGTVAATRNNETPSELDWRLILAWSEETESWLVWTIEETS